MPRSDEIDISTGQGSGTGVDIGIGAGGMEGGFIEAMAQELDNAANTISMTGGGQQDQIGVGPGYGSVWPGQAVDPVVTLGTGFAGMNTTAFESELDRISSGYDAINQGIADERTKRDMRENPGAYRMGGTSDTGMPGISQNESPLNAAQAGADVNDFLSATRGSDIRRQEELGITASTPTTFEDFIQQGANLSGTQQAMPTGGGQSWANPNMPQPVTDFITDVSLDPQTQAQRELQDLIALEEGQETPSTQHGFQTRALDEGISPPQINQSSSDEEKLAAVQQKSAETGEDPTSIIGKILSGVMQFIPGMGIVKALTGGLPQSNIPTFHGGFQKLPDGGGWDWFGDPRIKGSFMGMPYGPPKQIDRTSPEWLLYGSEPDGPNPFFQKYPWLQQLPQRLINRAVEDGEFLRELIRAQEADELWLYMSEQ